MSLPRSGFAVIITVLAATASAAALLPTSIADPLFQAAYESYDVGATQAFYAGALQSTPTAVAAGDMNGDGLADLVVAAPGGPGGAFTGNTVSVLLRRSTAATPPLFQAKINSAAGTGPIAVALGDMNGDGKLDAVTADYAGNTVSVLLGDGAGHLSLAIQKAAGTHPYGIALGDLNGDGLLDVVDANSGSNTVSTWMNAGGGVLGARTDYATQLEPRGVAIAPFNADAALDVIACNYGNGTLSLFTNVNNGTGALNAAVNVPVGNKPTAIALGLLDANGTTDVAVACSSRVVTRLSNGAGGFGGGVNVTIPVNPLAITVKDFTGTTLADIAVAGLAVPGAPNVALIPDVSGATSGTVAFYRGGPTPWGITGAALASTADIVVANTGDMAAGDPTHTVSVLRRDLAGAFGSGLDVSGGTRSDVVASADLNRDGVLDLVIGGADPNGLMTALGLGTGTFAAPGNVAIGSGDVSWVGTLDANRDGVPDILFARPASSEVDLALGNSGGGFGAPALIAAGYREPIAVGDLNRDGIDDFIATSGATAQVFLGTGSGTFAGGISYTAIGPSSFRAITLGDWNRDAKLDFAISADTGVLRYLGNGDGTFGSAATFLGSHTTYGGAVADLNLDGLPDLAVVDEGVAPITGSEAQGITLLPGDGLGGFGTPALFPALDLPQSLAIADVNRDGKPDLLAKDRFTTAADQALSVLLGNGAGSFAARTDYAAGSGPLGLALGDFNRDGLVDVAGAGAGNAGGVVRILRGAAPGTFGTLNAKTDYGIAAMVATAIAGGDVDRDGKKDIVMVGTVSGAPMAVTQLGDGTGAFFGGILTSLSGVDPRSVVLADVNRDGILDMVVGNGNSTNVYVLIGNGGTFGPPQARATDFPPYFVAVGDINRDGIPDLVTANPTAAQASILIGQGTGAFNGPVQLGTVNGITGIAIGDMNRDGLPDVVATGGGTGVIRLTIQLSNGTFSQNGQVTIGPGTINPAFGDFNRDGWPDVAVGSSGGGGRVSVILGNGSGGFAGSAIDYALPSAPTQVTVADMNGDGALDLVASEPGDVSVVTGVGGPGGGFNTAVNYLATSAKGSVVLDMNQDGRPDVVAANGVEQTSSVFLNGGSVTTGVAVGGTPAAKPSLAQNAPNPFNPRTVIRFTMARAGHARLLVYDAAGRRIATLLDGPAPAGERRVEWSGRDDSGRAMASGIYFYRLEAEGVALSRRMALLK